MSELLLIVTGADPLPATTLSTACHTFIKFMNNPSIATGNKAGHHAQQHSRL
jgi:hypothetical protein